MNYFETEKIKKRPQTQARPQAQYGPKTKTGAPYDPFLDGFMGTPEYEMQLTRPEQRLKEANTYEACAMLRKKQIESEPQQWSQRQNMVLRLQNDLNEAGVRDAQGKALRTDGVFGPKTRNAWDTFAHKALYNDKNLLEDVQPEPAPGQPVAGKQTDIPAYLAERKMAQPPVDVWPATADNKGRLPWESGKPSAADPMQTFRAPFGNAAQNAAAQLNVPLMRLEEDVAETGPDEQAQPNVLGEMFSSVSEKIKDWNTRLTDINAQDAELQRQITTEQNKAIAAALNGTAQKIGPPIFYMVTSQQAPDPVAQNNYKTNKQHDITGTIINNQNVASIADFQYGDTSADGTGCGPISAYNALTALGLEPSLATVINQLEKGPNLSLGAHAGTNPYNLGDVLSQYDVDYQKKSSVAALDESLQVGDTAILNIWNDKNDIMRGAHFFAVKKTEDGFEVYNNGGESIDKPPKSLEGVLANGNFITGYVIKKK